MEFTIDIPVDRSHAPNELFAFCFAKLRDLWPDAVGITGSGTLCYRGALRMTEREELTIVKVCQSYDQYLALKIFGRGAPLIQLNYTPYTLHVSAANGAADIARRFVQLPCWGRTVSERLEKIHG